jgi:putative ABC transport system substrate-binding protein
MRRREFITLLGSAAIAWPRALIAQPTDRVRRVGVLSGSIDYGGFPAFQSALRELGWAEGRNLRLDFRQATGEVEQVRTFAKELVGLQPDVIVAGGTPSLVAFLHETHTIPIVFVMVGDPVGQGMIQSLARPGGNFTGFTNFEFSMGTKWLELLKEVAPHVTRIGIIFDPQTSPGGASYFLRPIETAAASFAVDVTAMPVHDDSGIEAAITALVAQPGGGLITVPDVFTAAHREIIINLVG